MEPSSDRFSDILQRLKGAPLRLKRVTGRVPPARLYRRSAEEPWSVSDILAHLRACSAVWGGNIIAMLTHGHPTLRYVSPRTWIRKTDYLEQEFGPALKDFAHERINLLATLAKLDAPGWARRGTFTGTTPRGRDQTVLSMAERLANHEQGHIDQIETLLT